MDKTEGGVNGSAPTSAAGSTSQGAWFVNPTSTTSTPIYLNGAASGSANSTTATSVASADFYLFAQDEGDSPPPGSYSADTLGYAFVSGGLTAACEFRCNPATDSDLKPATVPK